MLNLNAGSKSQTSRIESDREVLPFPAGGVFGPARPGPAPSKSDSRVDSTMRLTQSIEAELDSLQQQLDGLTVELDADEARDLLAAIPFRRFQNTDDPSPPPSAA